jgi:hypothetical protein
VLFINTFYFLLFFLLFRYAPIFRLKNLSSWTMPLAFCVKILMGLFFCYVYIYSLEPGAEPSDAIRFLEESKQLWEVFYKSPGDFFALITGIGDDARMIHEHMHNTFIWDAGNFTTVNDSRNTIRVHTLLHFISFGSVFVHTVFMCALSLIGLQQLYLSFQSFSKLPPLVLFFSLLLFPSLLFWSSSILKEPLLLLGVGLFTRALLVKEGFKKGIIFGLLGALLLIFFKPYIFLCILPSLAFYLPYKYLMKEKIVHTLVFSFSILVILLLAFPTKRQSVTENLSRKQFDVENVGRGGIHASHRGGYYYFKPHQYKNIKVTGGFVELIHPSNAILLSVDTRELPREVHLLPTKELWRIHIVMPGTNSYIKTTAINNSFSQLLLNIPEALINSFFRPFPLDSGSFLRFPAMLEVWLLSGFLFLAIYRRRKIDAKTRGIIAGLFIFSICLLLLIGWTTPVTGAIARFRFPAHLSLFLVGALLIDLPLNKKKITHE